MDFLTGAAVALFVQLVVQLFVIPRVESRKRADDRWERNVLQLGELLTGQVVDLGAEARSPSYGIGWANDAAAREDIDQNRRLEVLVDDQVRYRDAQAAFSAVAQHRVEWLARRIVGHASSSPKLVGFDKARRRYWLTVVGVDVVMFGTKGEGHPTGEEVSEVWERERVERLALVAEVERLLDLRHPPRPSRRVKARQRLRSWTAPLGRWRARREVRSA